MFSVCLSTVRSPHYPIKTQRAMRAFRVESLLRFPAHDRRASAEAKVLLHAAEIPRKHILHHADIAVDVHRLAAVQLIQLAVKLLHERVMMDSIRPFAWRRFSPSMPASSNWV